MSAWTTADIPDQTGKLVVITGATGGLGYETALALAGKGAEVMLTGRSNAKGLDALTRIRAIHPEARIDFELLDLSRLASVREFADRFAKTHDRIDILVNNAGVMALPKRQVTADGFEMQFETNYLGHFALTALLLPHLLAAPAPRTVQLSSTAAQMGKLHFDDLQFAQRYSPFLCYAQSKLAMLMFALELQRRADRNGWHLLSTAAHPGYARTDLIPNGMGGGLASTMATLFGRVMSQSPAQGALPQLYAATSPEAKPGGYYGPDGLFEMTGMPKNAGIPHRAVDEAAAARLWSMSEEMAGIRFPQAARAA
ncbi:MAG: oxidoreductase [Devosia sp.]|nr:oxidoreductase [Devosia sp.]